MLKVVRLQGFFGFEGFKVLSSKEAGAGIFWMSLNSALFDGLSRVT
jgi:hypothetical protein